MPFLHLCSCIILLHVVRSEKLLQNVRKSKELNQLAFSNSADWSQSATDVYFYPAVLLLCDSQKVCASFPTSFLFRVKCLWPEFIWIQWCIMMSPRQPLKPLTVATWTTSCMSDRHEDDLSLGCYQITFSVIVFEWNSALRTFPFSSCPDMTLSSPLLPLDIFSECGVLRPENCLLTCKHWSVSCEAPQTPLPLHPLQKKGTNKTKNSQMNK